MNLRAFILLVVVTSVALASEALAPLPALEFQKLKIHGSFESIPILVEAAERGCPLVTSEKTEKEGTKPDAPKTSATDANGIAASYAQTQRDLDSAVKTNLAEIRKRRTDRLSGRLSGKNETPGTEEQAPVVDAAKPEIVSPWDEKSWKHFCECSKRTLPVLRARRRAELSKDPIAPLPLDGILALERGDGKEVSSEGIACGKYLGPIGAPMTDRNRELLIVASLGHPSADARFVTLWVSYKRWAWARKAGEGAKASHFWDFVLQRNAFRHLFSHQSLPTLDSHIQEYLIVFGNKQNDDKPKGLVIALSEKSLREAIESDLKASEDLKKYEANVCDKE